MNYEITVEPTIVLVRTAGPADLGGFTAMIASVEAMLERDPGRDVLIDHGALDVSGFDNEQIRELAAHVSNADPFFGRRCAVVMPTALMFGLGRMWQQNMLPDVSDKYGVFGDEPSARQWLTQ